MIPIQSPKVIPWREVEAVEYSYEKVGRPSEEQWHIPICLNCPVDEFPECKPWSKKCPVNVERRNRIRSDRKALKMEDRVLKGLNSKLKTTREGLINGADQNCKA